MKNLKKKIGGGNGFTLVEMLIVVAIIAILIAISIPLVNSALERAKHATDAANERAAKAEILIQYMAEGGAEADTNYYYNAADGSLKTAAPGIKEYGQHKSGSYDHTKASTGIIKVRISNTGVVSMGWVKNDDATTAAPDNKGLCSSFDFKTPHS